ncbi:methyl-accepting chemotaxis protein [Pectobacterium polaris]|uniref:methyl-accepting chemotaxis protein n=1 Tax=Pectobacterium polaris TaxID=2042057 RepID=UPI001CF30065|nr:methyl-accepting chemotaxis protein [Pectobacterium polaris]MCA6942656.1 methyl-accepting chemotaxis protein [Pectobacterium polaris]MCA6957280.1 methyl-accepting chemotaxis protein [Pectobacterium polaris]
MNFLKNMKIGNRLFLGFGLLIVLTLTLSSLEYVFIKNIEKEVDKITEDRIVKTNLLRDIRDHLNNNVQTVRDIILLPGDKRQEKQELRQTIIAITTASNETYSHLDNIIKFGKGRELFDELTNVRKRYGITIDQAIAYALEGTDEQATAFLFNDVAKIQKSYFTKLGELLDYQQENVEQSKVETKTFISEALFWTLLLSACSAVLGVLIAWLLTRSVTAPLSIALSSALRIGEGDLRGTIAVDSRDEFGQLLEAMRDMQSSLTKTVITVRDNAESVATASIQIAQGNADLSSRTEEQASALEETSSTMTQLGMTVKNNADNARQADQLAKNASTVAQQGGQVVDDVVETMKAIDESSRSIADIINVIDSIAFQTNILALNAAVEAARAGEQGRGFAVVAGEVRSLAQRSAEAAKEIKTLITTSVERVEQGSDLANKAGETMQQVVVAIRQLTDTMAEISSASAEQSTGVDQVGIAVNQMDQTTQQNAALVEESAAAALSLQEQADLLVRAVSVFKVAGNQSSIPAPQLTHRTLSPKALLPATSGAARQNSADWTSF